MDRITFGMLDNLADYLNKVTDSPRTAYTRTNGKLISNIDHFHVSKEYRGVSLHRMDNEQGGVSQPLGMGIFTKRELYSMIQAFIRGLEFNNN